MLPISPLTSRCSLLINLLTSQALCCTTSFNKPFCQRNERLKFLYLYDAVRLYVYVLAARDSPSRKLHPLLASAERVKFPKYAVILNAPLKAELMVFIEISVIEKSKKTSCRCKRELIRDYFKTRIPVNIKH